MLRDILVRSSASHPDRLAIRAQGRDVTYAELDRLAERFARALHTVGVGAGDRVGLWLDKSVAAVAAMQGALRLGAAYVPVDPMSPPARARTILGDADIRHVVTTADRLPELPPGCVPIVTDEWGAVANVPDGGDRPESPLRSEHDLAYILYTSGSTGKPKGVCISHRNALAFVEWAHEILETKPEDRFSSHAPFHFDLSVLDLYAAFLGGACVCLIPESSAYIPHRLVEFLRQERISVWYSVPSALALMIDQAGMLDVSPMPIRSLLFAGEPMPIRHVRVLRERFPEMRLLNLYGPTETNVCTWYEVGSVESDRVRPVPIGKASCGDRVWAVDETGNEAETGQEGELFVSGPTVMLGYWGREPQGDRPYPTGDIVRMLPDGDYEYVGRRDHMVKVRGHRVELGDIEAALLAHPDIQEGAVIVTGQGVESRLVAFLVSSGGRPSLLSVKAHCAERLPRYMIVDSVRWCEALPRTRNGKVDRAELLRLTT